MDNLVFLCHHSSLFLWILFPWNTMFSGKWSPLWHSLSFFTHPPHLILTTREIGITVFIWGVTHAVDAGAPEVRDQNKQSAIKASGGFVQMWHVIIEQTGNVGISRSEKSRLALGVPITASLLSAPNTTSTDRSPLFFASYLCFKEAPQRQQVMCINGWTWQEISCV